MSNGRRLTFWAVGTAVATAGTFCACSLSWLGFSGVWLAVTGLCFGSLLGAVLVIQRHLVHRLLMAIELLLLLALLTPVGHRPVAAVAIGALALAVLTAGALLEERTRRS